MRGFFFACAIAALGFLAWACAHERQAGPAAYPTTTDEANSAVRGPILSGTGGPVRFGSPEMPGAAMNTRRGLESSSQYTPFGGRVGDFPPDGDGSAVQPPGGQR